MKIAVFAVVALLSGCAVTSEVVPMGKDSYMLSSSSPGGPGVQNGAVTAVKAASQYCEAHGKHMIFRHTTSTRFGLAGITTDLVFSCVDENDPEYTRPNVRKDNGVSTIENR
jgi:hypothetical protein